MEKRKGFSLIETVIVFSIIVALTGIAVPSLKEFISSSRLQEVAWTLVEDLRTAKESAVLYQQDLRVYFCHDPVSSRNFYMFETYLKNPITMKHYTPGDSPDGKHFIKRKLKYNFTFDSHGPFKQFGYINGKEYYYLTFYCGKGSHFRGQPSGFDTITIVDPSTNKKFYVVIDIVGRIRMSGKHL